MEYRGYTHLEEKSPMHTLIQIPKPCSADWQTMTPDAGGRHCGQCCKTVIDFTDWKSEDIVQYLKSNTGTCGRFRKDQLDVPIPAPEVFVQQLNRAFLPVSRKAAAILLFVFCIMGASCTSSGPGQSLPAAQHTTLSHNAGITYLTGDTVMPVIPPEPDEHRLMGEPAIVEDTGTVEAQPVSTLGGAPVLVDEPEVIVPDTTSASSKR
ncbi:hypothetical protein B0I18_11430 [Taibaiella chishuiensis]|uniref:Uncharacterized protein n=2 Tax=Taibaiella chishuiensis TaxID=1434707 RepID=A0A2P8CV51_9BACT|nr:hypothetical protein B0I18_11430 [Taibaiella chishuiensis]